MELNRVRSTKCSSGGWFDCCSASLPRISPVNVSYRGVGKSMGLALCPFGLGICDGNLGLSSAYGTAPDQDRFGTDSEKAMESEHCQKPPI